MTHGPIPGMLSLEALGEAVGTGEIDQVLVVFPDMYGRFMGKRATGHFFMEHVARDGMHACNYLLACDMEMDPVPGYGFASWDKGYGDFLCKPDLSTLRRASWLPNTALVLCDLLTAAGDALIEVSPRRMLRRQLDRAADLGYTVMAGSEIELYCFNETYDTARRKHYHDLEPMASYIEDYHIFQGTKEDELIGSIRRALDASGVPVEVSKGEWGPGQQEVNLAYSDALSQSDSNVIYKHAAKEIAHAHGRAVTFMAKWDETLAGSSMHVHLSLWKDGGKRNAFASEERFGPVRANEIFRWFLGGWIKHTAALTVFYAPNVSSYKRFQEGSFAPTSIAWSYDNRTAGFRVLGDGSSLRIECRIPGADANPYLVYAAAIAAGLDGIQNRVEPPQIFEGDIYAAADLPRVPRTLRDATAEFEQSALARAVFGDAATDHYLHFLRTEQRKYDEVVTCWERARFFERA